MLRTSKTAPNSTSSAVQRKNYKPKKELDDLRKPIKTNKIPPLPSSSSRSKDDTTTTTTTTTTITSSSISSNNNNNTMTQLLVREKMFSWSGDDFRIKTLDGQLYQGGVYVKGKVFGIRDQMTVMDPLDATKPLAVCLRKFEFIGQTFKIYTLDPLFEGQRPSDRTYSNRPLYTYAKVERVPFAKRQQVTFANQSTPSVVITRRGWFPKTRTVTNHRGQQLALMEGGTFDVRWNTYKLTVRPGIDPLLIVCLTAICDEMDEQR